MYVTVQRSKLFLFLLEQHIERGHGAVTAGDILLQFHLLAVGELAVRVDLLFQYPQLISHPHDFVEERFERDFLGLQAGVGRLQPAASRASATPQTSRKDFLRMNSPIGERVAPKGQLVFY